MSIRGAMNADSGRSILHLLDPLQASCMAVEPRTSSKLQASTSEH